MSVLVAFGTIEGQTRKIAEAVAGQVRELGYEIELFDTADRIGEAPFEGVEAVFLAASVHERRHPKAFEVFVSGHQRQLAEVPVMFLSVSMNAAFDEFRKEAQGYVDDICKRTGFTPDETMLVEGAIRPESYDYYAAQVLRHVVLKGKDVDPMVETVEFTDWNALRKGVARFLGRAERT